MGVRHFSVGTDIAALHQCWKSQGEDLRKGSRRQLIRRIWRAIH